MPANDVMHTPPQEPRRWRVQVIYRKDRYFTTTSVYYVDEIWEVDDIVEAGPNFYAIERVIIVINPAIRERKTTLADVKE